MADDASESLDAIADVIDDVGERLEGAFNVVDRNRPVPQQLAVLRQRFQSQTRDRRAALFVMVMSLLEGDDETLEAARHGAPDAILTWRLLLALPMDERHHLLSDWSEDVLDE
jgi:hypothetical protein